MFLDKRIFIIPLVLLASLTTVAVAADDDPVVFRSDVSLARVDAQVVDRNNRTITGLHAEDFVLREDGKPQQVRNFASENMPIDILFLIDVSASMRPHVQRMSDAAHDALRVLADKDRVAIMVFDTYTRTRMPFRSQRSEINRGLSDVLNQERFNGGTQITRAMMAAADYVRREARPEARRAIVILTDDGSQDAVNEEGVERALSHADAVLSFLRCPDMMDQRRGGGGGYPGRTPTTFPGGGGWPGSNGPIILGGGGRRTGRGYPGGTYNPNHSAGTAEIARDSGGDTFSIDDASALEDTLTRLRQRYALHFNSADTVATNAHRTLQVDLAEAARRRHPDAEIRYRRVYMSGTAREDGAIAVTKAHAPEGGAHAPEGGSSSIRTADASPGPASGIDEMVTPKRRRLAVDQSYGTDVNIKRDEKDK